MRISSLRRVLQCSGRVATVTRRHVSQLVQLPCTEALNISRTQKWINPRCYSPVHIFQTSISRKNNEEIEIHSLIITMRSMGHTCYEKKGTYIIHEILFFSFRMYLSSEYFNLALSHHPKDLYK